LTVLEMPAGGPYRLCPGSKRKRSYLANRRAQKNYCNKTWEFRGQFL